MLFYGIYIEMAGSPLVFRNIHYVFLLPPSRCQDCFTIMIFLTILFDSLNVVSCVGIKKYHDRIRLCVPAVSVYIRLEGFRGEAWKKG